MSPPIQLAASAHVDGVLASAAAYSRQPWPLVTLEVRLSDNESPTSQLLICSRSSGGAPRCVGPLLASDGYTGLAPDGSLERRDGFAAVSSVPLRF